MGIAAKKLSSPHWTTLAAAHHHPPSTLPYIFMAYELIVVFHLPYVDSLCCCEGEEESGRLCGNVKQ